MDLLGLGGVSKTLYLRKVEAGSQGISVLESNQALESWRLLG